MICNYCGLTQQQLPRAYNLFSCTSKLSPDKAHQWVEEKTQEKATRTPLNVRFDLLEASFLQAMAQIGHYGAIKFGDKNYQKSRMVGKNSPANHMMNHLCSYICKEKYNHPEIGTDRKYHLAAVAFNAMMEFWYEEHPEVKE